MARKKTEDAGTPQAEADAAAGPAVNLSMLAPNKGARRPRKRLGIGEGSGNGKTSGRGQKGQKSRTGAPIPAGFEGGQMPLHRRLPKFGFTSRKRISRANVFNTIKLSQLEELASGSEPCSDITVSLLKERGMLSSKSTKVKILGDGALTKKVVVEAHAASASARAAIEAAGGELRLLDR